MRISLHFLPDYKNELTQYLSKSTNQSINIASFSSTWDGFDPVLQVHDISVGTVDKLHISRISFYFSFMQSVLALKPKFDRILIEKSEIAVKQENTGHWGFLDFNSSDFKVDVDKTRDSNSRFLSYLAMFNGATLNIKDFNAVIYNEKRKIRTLRLPTLNVNYSNNELFASGKLLQQSGDKALLNFSLKGHGLLKTGAIKGILYVEARSSEFFGELLGVYDWQNISIQDIDGSARAWINFDGMSMSSIYGDFQVSEINWKAAEKSLEPIRNLAFSYLWQQESSRNDIVINNFDFEWAGNKCEPTDVKIFINELDINVLADNLNVECINKLAVSTGILTEELQNRLSVSEPSGYVNNINLTFFTLNSNIASNVKENISFTFEAMLKDININAYEVTPSGKNLEGYIFANNESGFVSFLSDNFELGFPELFLDPWELKRAEGLVSWSITDSEVNIYSDGLRLWREDNSLIYGDFNLSINDQAHEDYLFLALGLQDVTFQDTVKFVPFYVVDNDLYTWLSRSLVAGSVNNGIYYGYGSVETDSAQNSFTSSIFLQSKNGIVQFEPEWPYIEELEVDITIQNGQLEIKAKQAKLAGTSLDNLKAYLPEVDEGRANFLTLSAEAQLTSELVNYWLLESPIAKNTKAIMQNLTINTSAHTSIQLKIPVTKDEGSNHTQDVEYLVNTTVLNGDVLHIPSKLSFEDVTGMISVDSQAGVNAKNIHSKLFNKPTHLAIATSFFNQNKSQPLESPIHLTKLSLNGNLGIASLFDYFGSTKVDFLEGDFNYLAELTISNEENKYPLLNIKTDLFGASCLCPAPFAKSSQEKEDLNLSLLLKPDQSYLTATLNSKHIPSLEAELLFSQEKLSFGEVIIGGAKVEDTDVTGFNIAANIKLANLENWITFLSEVIKQRPDTNPNLPNEPYLKKVQLYIEDLDGFGYLFQKNHIMVTPKDDKWLFNLTGKDINGKVILSNKEAPLILDFEQLNLVSLDKLLEKPKTVNSDSSDIIDPRVFPKLSFSTKNLMLENRPIGSWRFDILPDETGSIFRNIKGHIKGSNISGQLNWRFSQESKNTIATFDISGKDISSVFDSFEIPILMTSNRYKSDLALHWLGSPIDFSLEQLSGNISLSLEDGFLKTEDEKTGALRLFGVLNAESIKRRLKLDFSDLYKSGVGYDTFISKASIDQGLLTLTEPLVIDGPAGKYVLNGRIDLSTKALDIDMLVELPFSQNVPLAALVLGAPQIGGLVWVADKLLGEPLSALTTSRYDITGSWDKPTVNLKQAINASKKDRSKERGNRDAGNQ
ncbi:MAG: hypothetical protein ACJAS1_004221 [Oleiphilaceae bacterium]|jgi:uncharacterized protein (TIGR02099 family)